ncbi:MAG: GNAT family N-acetyltransferase [Actinomycetota bacterium]
MTDVEVREVAPEGFAHASAVSARSLVHLFSSVGDDPVERLLAAYRTYAYPDVPSADHLVVAAYADGYPVAFARATVPSRCACDNLADAPEAVNEEQAGMLAYRRWLAPLHPDAPHWWFGPVGVEPGLERRGLGTRVMTYALRRIEERGGGPVVLEAAPSVAPFYRRLGFADLARGTDPDGDDLVIQRRDL